MLLDKRITLREHVQYVIEKTHKAIKLLYSMISHRSKLNEKNKFLLYKISLRPIMTYASPLLPSIAKSHLNKMQICQNKILRMILNKPSDTRINDLHELANIESVATFINHLKDRFDAKVEQELN